MITFWILAIVFGFISLGIFRKFIIKSINTLEAVLFLFGTPIAAFSIGVLHSGGVNAFLAVIGY